MKIAVLITSLLVFSSAIEAPVKVQQWLTKNHSASRRLEAASPRFNHSAYGAVGNDEQSLTTIIKELKIIGIENGNAWLTAGLGNYHFSSTLK